MKKVIDFKGNVGVTTGKRINWRKMYNGNGKYEDEPLNPLWEEDMDSDPK